MQTDTSYECNDSKLKVEIRPLHSSDMTMLANVAPDVFDHSIDLERLAAFLRGDLHLMVVATDSTLVIGQIRAMVHLQPDGHNQLYIDNLGVSPAYRRKGIARALLREAFRWGKDHGCLECWVATEQDNHAARALYDLFKCAPDETMSYYQLNLGALDEH